jgi:hypothetical protein
MVKRTQDSKSRSTVRLRLTAEGTRRLATLGEQQLEELIHLAPTMHTLWSARQHATKGQTRPTSHPAAPPNPR